MIDSVDKAAWAWRGIFSCENFNLVLRYWSILHTCIVWNSGIISRVGIASLLLLLGGCWQSFEKIVTSSLYLSLRLIRVAECC